MTRVKSKIAVFFLLLASVVFYAHMFIPHDHHLYEADTRDGEKCPSAGNGSGSHKGFPVHCHAFNNLTAEKAAIFSTVLKIQSPDFVAGTSSGVPGPILQYAWIKTIDLSNKPVNSLIPGLSSLRAPPSFI